MRPSPGECLLAVASKVSIATVGWLVVEAPPPWQRKTLKRHQALLAQAKKSPNINSDSRRVSGGPTTRADRSKAHLLHEINLIVRDAVAQAADGIARACQCDVDYDLVFVTQGNEEIRDRVKLGVVPFFIGATEVLELNHAALGLPQKHQTSLSRYVALYQELDFARTWRGFEYRPVLEE